MPMIRVEKAYRFTAPGGGDARLPDLFDGSRQLVLYGRQEEWEDSPEGWPQTPPYTWATWHDRYGHTL